MVDAAKELNHELVKVKIGARLPDSQVAGVLTDAKQMTKRQVRQASRPPTGTLAFDPRMGAFPVGRALST